MKRTMVIAAIIGLLPLAALLIRPAYAETPGMGAAKPPGWAAEKAEADRQMREAEEKRAREQGAGAPKSPEEIAARKAEALRGAGVDKTPEQRAAEEAERLKGASAAKPGKPATALRHMRVKRTGSGTQE